MGWCGVWDGVVWGWCGVGMVWCGDVVVCGGSVVCGGWCGGMVWYMYVGMIDAFSSNNT